MTSQEILQMSLADDKEINKHRKKLSYAYRAKRAAWRALWPFTYITYSGFPKVMFIIGAARAGIYAILALAFVEWTNSMWIGLILFTVLYLLKFSLWMFLARKAIKKEMDALAEYEQKYRDIRADYYREEMERNAIVRVNGGFQHVGANGLTTLLRENRIYMYGQLDDTYGNIWIYPQNNGIAPTKEEEEIDIEDIPSVNKKIASIKFIKFYTVYTDKDNTNRCFTYLTPTILQGYVDGADRSGEILVYTVRGDQMEVRFKGEVPDSGMDRFISFISYDKEDDIEDPFCKFQAKVSIYERYFADMIRWISEVAKERDYRFLFKEGV